MSTTDGDLIREAIRRTLTQRTVGAPDASAVAEATLTTWHQMAARLAPVIGARGVDALFSRALHVTSSAYPWLAIAGGRGDSAAHLAGLTVQLEANKAAVAAEASHALLVNFTELLATLIGESLTVRLLAPVWAPLTPSSEQEAAP